MRDCSLVVILSLEFVWCLKNWLLGIIWKLEFGDWNLIDHAVIILNK